jgi:hypothetical protein
LNSGTGIEIRWPLTAWDQNFKAKPNCVNDDLHHGPCSFLTRCQSATGVNIVTNHLHYVTLFLWK